MNMSKIFVSLCSVLLLLLFFSIFIIQEGERGIVLQFNNIIKNNFNKNIIYTPGLHFKLPILETVKILDARIHTIENNKEHFLTAEKKDLILDYYIQWKINDFSRYYNFSQEKNISEIEMFLKQKINNYLQVYISSLSMKEIIASSEKKLTAYIVNLFNNQKFALNTLSSIPKNNINSLGIKLIDIRIQKINLSDKMYTIIYDHMRSEQKTLAFNKRFQGKERMRQLHAVIDRKISIILSKAQKKAFLIKGTAEAKVIQLFAKHFNHEPDFYFFVRSLRAYENSFKNHENVILINLHNKFFHDMQTITDMIK